MQWNWVFHPISMLRVMKQVLFKWKPWKTVYGINAPLRLFFNPGAAQKKHLAAKQREVCSLLLVSNRLCRSDWNIQFPPVYYIKLYFGSPSAVGGHSSSHCSQSIPFPFLLSASFTPSMFPAQMAAADGGTAAVCVCERSASPVVRTFPPNDKKTQTTCTHMWTHGSTRVKTNTLLATREKTLVLVFFLFPWSPQCCYISARITIQFRVGCLCVIHTYVPGTVTNRHIDTLQLCEILCKGNPRWEKLTAGTNWISLSLFIIMTQSVHSFLICICLLLFYIGEGGGGTYIYIHSVYTAMQIFASKHLSKGN